MVLSSMKDNQFTKLTFLSEYPKLSGILQHSINLLLQNWNRSKIEYTVMKSRSHSLALQKLHRRASLLSYLLIDLY